MLIFKSLPKNVATVSLTIKKVNKMNLEQLKAIQMRYLHADQIILVDLEDKEWQLNPSLSRADANAYVRFGFKVSAPSLFPTTSFFVVSHKEKLQQLAPSFEQKLHPSLMEGIKRFGGYTKYY
ncbi:hypothetical protein [Legionella sainthelensi]|uniref:hypothetical protein n=1 Tax=Legionella sainthelensi TaxID=28087 RepID=UPI000E202FB6|nr:hypothetical protein [Legionella sainthelensi]